jgi:hypothetical protein
MCGETSLMTSSGERSVRPTAASWPILPAVQDSQEFDCFWVNPVGYQVRRAGDDEFTRPRQPANPAHLRMPPQLAHGVENAACNCPGSGRVIVRDGPPDVRQIANRGIGPGELHKGGSPSSSLPQLANHFATLS